MQILLTILHVLLSIGIITLVLLQHGKGADAGAAFGGGASGTVFGARGAGNFLSRSTAILATLFFVTSIGLAYYSTQAGKQRSLMEQEGPVAVAPGADVTESDRKESPADVPGDQAVPVPARPSSAGTDVPAIDDVPVPSGE